MIRIRNIKVDVKTNNLKEMISKKIKTDNFTIQKILHKSIDARNKSNVLYVYDVLISTNEKIRFNEDALRMLRAYRFCAKLGFSMDETVKKSIDTNASLIQYVSIERIVHELKEIMETNHKYWRV